LNAAVYLDCFCDDNGFSLVKEQNKDQSLNKIKELLLSKRRPNEEEKKTLGKKWISFVENLGHTYSPTERTETQAI
jgi:hypothetical protein